MINLNKADSQAIRGLNSLREPGFQGLLKFFQEELEATKQKLIYADDINVIHRLQGKAEAYEDLLKAVEESQKVMKGH
jgi:hypothetical protein